MEEFGSRAGPWLGATPGEGRSKKLSCSSREGEGRQHEENTPLVPLPRKREPEANEEALRLIRRTPITPAVVLRWDGPGDANRDKAEPTRGFPR